MIEVKLKAILFSVVMTKHHMLFSYNECRLSVVHFTRSPPEGHILERLSALDPRIHTCEVAGPSGRRFERKLSANLSGDMVSVITYICGKTLHQNDFRLIIFFFFMNYHFLTKPRWHRNVSICCLPQQTLSKC